MATTIVRASQAALGLPLIALAGCGQHSWALVAEVTGGVGVDGTVTG